MQATGIRSAELADRRARLLDHAGTTVVLFDQAYIQYYTGFNFLSNERPVVVVVGDELTAFVPGFEVERTESEGHFDRVEQYPEYPGEEHPMTALARLVAGPLAADQDGYPGILGYEGPALSEVTGSPVATLGRVHRGPDAAEEPGRGRADPAELPLVRARPPPAPAVLGRRRDRGGGVAPRRDGGDAGDARGARPRVRRPARLAGRRDRRVPRPDRPPLSAWAHAVAHNIRFEEGDMLVSETAAPVWGYNAELERGMVVGEPTDEQRRLHASRRRRPGGRVRGASSRA